jgi:hypothetical protein
MNQQINHPSHQRNRSHNQHNWTRQINTRPKQQNRPCNHQQRNSQSPRGITNNPTRNQHHRTREIGQRPHQRNCPHNQQQRNSQSTRGITSNPTRNQHHRTREIGQRPHQRNCPHNQQRRNSQSTRGIRSETADPTSSTRETAKSTISNISETAYPVNTSETANPISASEIETLVSMGMLYKLPHHTSTLRREKVVLSKSVQLFIVHLLNLSWLNKPLSVGKYTKPVEPGHSTVT